jgi:hypothetical protein
MRLARASGVFDELLVISHRFTANKAATIAIQAAVPTLTLGSLGSGLCRCGRSCIAKFHHPMS